MEITSNARIRNLRDCTPIASRIQVLARRFIVDKGLMPATGKEFLNEHGSQEPLSKGDRLKTRQF
jgi:hypothetical protein